MEKLRGEMKSQFKKICIRSIENGTGKVYRYAFFFSRKHLNNTALDSRQQLKLWKNQQIMLDNGEKLNSKRDSIFLFEKGCNLTEKNISTDF